MELIPGFTRLDLTDLPLHERLIRRVITAINNIADRVSSVENRPREVDLADIRVQLSAGGQYPLNVGSLQGMLARPQLAKLLVYTSAPTGAELQRLTDGQLIAVSGSPAKFYYVIGGNPNTLSQLSTVPTNYVTTDTNQDVGSSGSAQKNFFQTLFSKMGTAGSATLSPSAADNLLLWLTAAPASTTYIRDNAANTNLANGNDIGIITFVPRFNGGYNSVAQMKGTYSGNGTTRKGRLSFLTSNAGALTEQTRIDESGDLTQLTGQFQSLVQFGAQAYINANQSINNTTSTAISFTTSTYDHGSLVSGTTFTVPTRGAGIWMVTGQVAFAANAVGERRAQIVANGGVVIAEHSQNTDAVAAATTIINCSTLVKLADGDTLSLYVYQDSGGALNALSGLGSTFMAAQKLC